MPIPSTYDEQHRNILRSLAKYIEKNNPHHPLFDTIYNDPALLHRYVSQMRVNWLEVSSAVNIDRNRAYHWYYETHLRKVIDAKVSFEDKEIIRDMILRGIADKSIMANDFQAKIKSKMSRDYHRAEFTMTYNNILRSKAVKIAMMKAGITLSGKKPRNDNNDDFSSKRMKGSTMMYPGNSGTTSPNYVVYNGQNTHRASSSRSKPSQSNPIASPAQPSGWAGDVGTITGTRSVGFNSTMHSHTSTPGYYSPKGYGADGQAPAGFEEGEGNNVDSIANDSNHPAFPSLDTNAVKQSYQGANNFGGSNTSESSLGSGNCYLGAPPQWFNNTPNYTNEYHNFTPLAMYSSAVYQPIGTISQDHPLYGYMGAIPSVSIPYQRDIRQGYETSPLVGMDHGAFHPQPFSAGMYIESIPSSAQPVLASVDESTQQNTGVSYNDASMSCNPSVNAEYASGISNGVNSTSNMGMCFQGTMHQVPSFLGLLPHGIQHPILFGTDVPISASTPYNPMNGLLGPAKNDTPLSFGEPDHFYPHQTVKMPLEFLDGFSSSRIGLDKHGVQQASAEGQQGMIYPGVPSIHPYIEDSEYNGDAAFGTGESRLRDKDKESLADIMGSMESGIIQQRLKKDDFPWDQLGEKLKTLQD